MSKKKIFVQLWDCPTCGHKGLNALLYKECPDCQQVLSDDFLTDTNYVEAMELDENDPQYKRALEGPDWLCPVCGKRNSARYENCSCGNSRGEISGAVGAVDSGGQTTGGVKDWMKDGSQLEANKRKTAKAAADKKGFGRLILIGSLVAAALLVFFLFFFKVDVAVTAQSLSWERSVQVQVYTENVKTGWEDELPSGAQVVSRNREVYGYQKIKIGEHTETQTVTKTRQIQTGTRDVTRKERRGNGTIEEVTTQEPVYKTESYDENVTKVVPDYRDDPIYKYKAVYRLREWVASQTLTEKGVNQAPIWPGNGLPTSVASPRLGDRRVGGQEEHYHVLFKTPDGKDIRQDLAFDKWSQIHQGQTYQAKKALLGGLEFQP